ncbi:cytochrome P450 [Nocardia arizonensis]|uniref:cytochrome P450 n=1 Tax=Nocardia arizonensis TaxID=1141647 RepID=UPI0006D0681A|nr:cytochrome P450 [Nocardia arizonensis]
MTSLDGGLGLALFEDDNIQDPYPLYERMHRTGPVHRIGDSDFYAVSSWEAVNEAVTRCADFSSNLTATMMYGPAGTVTAFPMGELGGPTQALATADEPTHGVHRKALLPHLAAKRVLACEPFIAETFERLWDLALDGGGIEWMAAMANKLPMTIVAGIVGVPDGDVDTLIRWGYSATQVVEGLVSEEQMRDAGVATLELAAYIADQFRQASIGSREGLLGDLAGASARGELDDTAALVMMITLFGAGGESTASLIGTAARILATDLDIQRRLREHPELLSPFLEEVLRYEPPFRGHYRHVVGDTELCGVRLRKGSRLFLLWGAANRDPAHFDDPAEFRLDRVAAKDHVSFGRGSHFCVGAALARLEARIAIGGLLDRTATFRADDAGRWLPSLLVRRLEHLHLNIG